MKNKIKYIVFGIIFASLMFVTAYASTSDTLMEAHYYNLYASQYPGFGSPYTIPEGEAVVNETTGELSSNVIDYTINGKNGFKIPFIRSFGSDKSNEIIFEDYHSSGKTTTSHYAIKYVCSEDGAVVDIEFKNEQELLLAEESFEGKYYDGLYSDNYSYTSLSSYEDTGVFYTMVDGAEPFVVTEKVKTVLGITDMNVKHAFTYFDTPMKLSKPTLSHYDVTINSGVKTLFMLFQDINGELSSFWMDIDTSEDPIYLAVTDKNHDMAYCKYDFSFVDNHDISIDAVHQKGFTYNSTLKSADGITYYLRSRDIGCYYFDVLAVEDLYENIYLINATDDMYEITTPEGVVYTQTTEGIIRNVDGEITELVSYTEEVVNNEADINSEYTDDDHYIFTITKNSGTSNEIADDEENVTKYYMKQEYRYPHLLNLEKTLRAYLPYRIELPNGLNKNVQYTPRDWYIGECDSNLKGYHYVVDNYAEEYKDDVKNNRTYTFAISINYLGSGNKYSYISRSECSQKNGNMVRYTKKFYDENYRLTDEIISHSSNGASTEQYEYTYNSTKADEKVAAINYIKSVNGFDKGSHKKTYSYTDMGFLSGKTNGNYHVDYSYYYNDYYLPKETIYKLDADTTVKIENLPTDDKKSIATTNVYENDILVKTTSYTYDTYGNIASETVNIDGDNSMITTYAYEYAPDGGYTLTTILKGVDDADGNALPDIVTVSAYDSDYNLIAQIDPNGNHTTMSYDKLGRLLTTQYPDGTSESYTYDISEGVTTYTAPDGTIYKAYFDGWGNRLKTTVILNDETYVLDSYEYSDIGELVEYRRYTGEEYIKSRYAYNYLGQLLYEYIYDQDELIKTTEYTYSYSKDSIYKPVSTVTLTITGDNGTYAQYSETTNYRGFLTESKSFTADDERVNTFTYDYVGNAVTATDAAGNVTTTAYDALNNPVSVTYADGSTVSTTYNGLGLTATQTDAMGNTAEYVYDNAGRLIKLYTPFDEDNKGLTKTYYDSNGNVISTKVLASLADDAENYTVTDNTYNNMNRLVSNAVYPTDSSAIYTRYEYNTMGNPTKVVSGLNSPEAPESTGHVVTYEYDTLGRMIKTTTPDGISESAEYDLQGRVLKSTDKANRDTLFTYDAFNNVLSMQTGTESVSYTYNLLGLRTSMTDSTGTTNYAYSPYGELTTETTGDIIKSYEYDLISNPTAFNVTNADESLISQSYTYDAIGRLMSVTNGTDTVAYTYDANSNMLTSAHNGDVYREVQYNNANLPVFTQLNNGENTADITRYIYSPDGNLAMSMGTDVSSMYYYDGAGRLIYENTWGDEFGYDDTFTYDSFGNRVSRAHRDYYGNTSENTEYTYNSINQLIEQSNGTNTTAYTYDAAGNMTTVTKNGATVKNYTYDNFNRLSSATIDGVISAYTYNGDNLRQSKTVNGVTTNHIYDGANIVADLGTDTTVFVRGNGLALLKNASATQVYGITPRGDVAKIISPDGTITDYTYTAFGETTGDNNNALNPFGYTGEYTDTETGLIYLRNRYYDPEIGMFITEDPAKDGLNWYVYCGSNPIMFVDPWGLYFLETDSEDGKVYAVIDLSVGDTLYSIAQAEVGDGNSWQKMGYGGDPGYLTDGERVDITGIYVGRKGTYINCQHFLDTI